jgi:hypothetical protein
MARREARRRNMIHGRGEVVVTERGLERAETFFQATFEVGVGFLDVRGQIARELLKDFQQFMDITEGDLLTAHVSRPKDAAHPVAEVKANIDHLWLHFRPATSWVTIREQTARITELVCSLVGVTRFKRLGLRSQYQLATQDLASALQLVRRVVIPADSPWAGLGEIQDTRLVLNVATGRIKMNIQISPFRHMRQTFVQELAGDPPAPADRPDEPPRIGALFDVDVFEDTLTDSRDPKPFIRRASVLVDETVVPMATRAFRGRAE